jgi:anti-anti-sigma factor
MSLALVSRGEYDVFVCTGDMKVNLLPLISPQLSKYIQTCPDKDLVLDLSGVDFIDSSTIRMFLNLHKRLEPAGKRLCLLAPSPGVVRIIDDVKLSTIFSLYPATADLEREKNGRLYCAYEACSSPDKGFNRLACTCPVCGSAEVHGYLIDENDYAWSWEGDNPFPVSRTRDGAEQDIMGLSPLVCPECFTCSLDYSHFIGRRPDGSVLQTTLSAEVVLQLSKALKTRKKLMESCVVIGDHFFDHPREKVSCYFLYQLAESTMRTLATSRYAQAPFYMGYINYAVMKYAPADRREEHLNNMRTWMSQVMADKGSYDSIALAKTYFAMYMAAFTLGRQKEAEKLAEEFTDFMKQIPAKDADTTSNPKFWFSRVQSLNEKAAAPIS